MAEWKEVLRLEKEEPMLFAFRQKEIRRHFFWSCVKYKVENLVQMKVTIKTPGNLETVVTLDNFKHKAQFYLSTYDEYFGHKHTKGLCVIGFYLLFTDGETLMHISDRDVKL